jgi:hypothetical protein
MTAIVSSRLLNNAALKLSESLAEEMPARP